MTEFKNGEKVRIVETGVLLDVEPHGDGFMWDGFWISEARLNALGLTIEKVEPPHPEEPPVGSVIRFDIDTLEHDWFVDATRYHNGWNTRWESGLNWDEVVDMYGTDFTLLESRERTIREVADWVDKVVINGDEGEPSLGEDILKHFGVK